jgi:hypothetical protein
MHVQSTMPTARAEHYAEQHVQSTMPTGRAEHYADRACRALCRQGVQSTTRGLYSALTPAKDRQPAGVLPAYPLLAGPHSFTGERLIQAVLQHGVTP